MKASLWHTVNTFKSDNIRGPAEVTAVTMLYSQLVALKVMFSSELPPLCLVQGTDCLEVVYVFGDASGSGFGSSWINSDAHSSDNILKVHFGVWGEAEKGRSSIYRELRNLIETLEHMGEKGSLKGKEVFVFTDIFVSKSIANQGMSSDPLLFNLVVQLLSLEMLYGCKIDIIHVSGNRMIAQGWSHEGRLIHCTYNFGSRSTSKFTRLDLLMVQICSIFIGIS